MRSLVTGLAMAALLLIVGIGAGADEEKIPIDKLPKAVLDAVKAKFPNAELTGAEKEEEKGKIEYEVALKYKGHRYEVILTPDGKITAIEKEIALKDLPKAVTAAIEAKYPRATLKLAEEVTKGEKVNYEVHLVTAQKRSVEVLLDASGKILHEEVQEKKEEKKKG